LVSELVYSTYNNASNSLNSTLNSVAAFLGISASFNLSLLGSNQLANINNRAQLFALSQISFPGATNNISFIPTVSSLGLINHNFNWSNPIANDLVCNNRIPFDNYFVPKQNEDHVSFSEESWRWLKAELERGHQGTDCISICGVNKINGKDFLCRNTSDIYSLNALIGVGSTTGVVTTWSCSAGLTILPIANNKNQQATVTAKSTAGYNEWIKATITNPCGAEQIVITKYIGSGSVGNYTLSFKKMCVGCCEYEARVSNTNPSAPGTFQWSTNGSTYTSATSTTYNQPTYGSYIGGINNLPANNPNIWVKITGTCGSTSVILLNATFTVTTAPLPGCSWKKEPETIDYTFKGQEVSAYPNPTNDVWHIQIPNYLNKQIKMSLYDMAGKEILRNEYSNLDNGIIDINSNGLVPNIYLLKVLIDDRVFHLKLMKE
jgi:Secretion system C-terminal sorting domain